MRFVGVLRDLGALLNEYYVGLLSEFDGYAE